MGRPFGFFCALIVDLLVNVLTPVILEGIRELIGRLVHNGMQNRLAARF